MEIFLKEEELTVGAIHRSVVFLQLSRQGFLSFIAFDFHIAPSLSCYYFPRGMICNVLHGTRWILRTPFGGQVMKRRLLLQHHVPRYEAENPQAGNAEFRRPRLGSEHPASQVKVKVVKGGDWQWKQKLCFRFLLCQSALLGLRCKRTTPWVNDGSFQCRFGEILSFQFATEFIYITHHITLVPEGLFLF